MKTQLKVLSVLAAALAVVFSTFSFTMAFNAPGEMANCREIDSGLSFECDPVSNLTVVNSSVIPVTGIALPSFTTSLRSINDLFEFTPDLSLSDFALANPAAVATSLRGVNDFAPSATELILADFVANPSVVATSLRAINEVVLGASGLSLSDFALTLPVVPELSLSDFAISASGLENLSLSDSAISTSGLKSLSLSDAALALQAKESMMMALPAPYYYGAR